MACIKLPSINDSRRTILGSEHHFALQVRLGWWNCLYGDRPILVKLNNPKVLSIRFPNLVVSRSDTDRTS